MSKLLPLLLLLVAIIAVYLVMNQRPLQRGMHGNVFVSSGKPPLTVTPGEGLHAVNTGVVNISPATDNNTASATARAWYALMDTPDDARRLVVILAEAADQWHWALDASSGQREVHVERVDVGGLPATVATFALSPDRDPWTGLFADAVPGSSNAWRNGSLVRRYTMLPDMRRSKLVIEYREPLRGDSPVPVLEDAAALAAFEKRANSAFALQRFEAGKTPSVDAKPATAPTSLVRRDLARSLGILDRRMGGNN